MDNSETIKKLKEQKKSIKDEGFRKAIQKKIDALSNNKSIMK